MKNCKPRWKPGSAKSFTRVVEQLERVHAEVQTAEGKLYLYVAIDRTSKFAFVATGQEDWKDLSRGVPRSSDRGCPIQDPHGPHR
jgi:hypothetical protein